MHDATGTLLGIMGLNKSFPGVRALSAIDFDLRAGEVHCLVGENGAGKSTLVEVIAGNYRPDSGTITVKGEKYAHLTPSRSIELGIETVHQEDQLAAWVTAAENIYTGNLPRTPLGLFSLPLCVKNARTLLSRLGLALDPAKLVANLSAVERKVVCIARALSRKAAILILDEPSAALGAEETKVLHEVVRRITAQGIGVIYITHYINEVFEIADRITVFKDGKLVATHLTRETSRDQVISEMVGRTTSGHLYARPHHAVGDLMLEVSGFRKAGLVHDISFTIREGEIFGIGGLVGSGRTELAQLLFGVLRRDAGTIRFRGREVTPENPLQAIRGGFGFLTEDRKQSGLVLGRSVKENISIARLNVDKPVFLNLRREKAEADNLVKVLRIATPTIEKLVLQLSGGNQQKVVLAKWLLSNSSIVIFDEPTVGIDVGAKREIYDLMDRMASEGKAIIMISSDLPELVSLSDRIGIMRQGRFVKILEREEASEETIMRYATGVEDEKLD
jgi:ribose transport system ATP-binding protein